MGKLKVSPEIDLANATISGCLKQIRRSNVSLPADHVPCTKTVWLCDIQPQSTKTILAFIEQHIKPVDSTEFTHVKRFRKHVDAENGKTYISAILCAAEAISENELRALLQSHFPDFSESRLCTGQIPVENPPTKELSVKWSNEIWPLSWKGNPNHQDLITAYFDVDEETQLIDQLLAHAAANTEHNGTHSPENPPIFTMVAEQDQATKKIRVLHISADSRESHVLQHSVMNAIAEVARAELERRENPQKSGNSQDGYLCHDLLVYTTHEPCTMCAMALVHSRIGRLIYVNTHPLGAIESSHYIGDRRDLNWTFDVWRWVGPRKVESPGLPDTLAP